MLESEEQIQTALGLAGEELQFSGCTIRGIVGHLVYNIQNFDSPYDIDKQDIDFQVSKKDFQTNTLSIKDRCDYILGSSKYCFTITKILDDLTGWFQLSVTLDGVTDV